METGPNGRLPTLLVAGAMLLIPAVLVWLSGALRLLSGTPAAVGAPRSPAMEVFLLAGLPAAALLVGLAVARRNPEARRHGFALAGAATVLLLLAVAAATLRAS